MTISDEIADVKAKLVSVRSETRRRELEAKIDELKAKLTRQPWATKGERKGRR